MFLAVKVRLLSDDSFSSVNLVRLTTLACDLNEVLSCWCLSCGVLFLRLTLYVPQTKVLIGTYSIIIRQPIEVESCSKPLKVRKVLQFRFKKIGKLWVWTFLVWHHDCGRSSVFRM